MIRDCNLTPRCGNCLQRTERVIMREATCYREATRLNFARERSSHTKSQHRMFLLSLVGVILEVQWAFVSGLMSAGPHGG